MNRKQRRAAVSKGSVSDRAKYLKDQESKIKKQVADRATTFCTEGLFSVFALVLHDELGFGKKRVEKLLSRVDKQFECITSGNVSLDDIKQEVMDKLNIEINVMGDK